MALGRELDRQDIEFSFQTRAERARRLWTGPAHAFAFAGAGRRCAAAGISLPTRRAPSLRAVPVRTVFRAPARRVRSIPARPNKTPDAPRCRARPAQGCARAQP